jgi:hypothetical protein
LLAALAMAAAVAPAEPVSYPPRPVPALYVTSNYNLTFRPPKGAWYCPLPDNWVGSDHGTLLFLESPAKCYGAGYPSSGRGFEPPATPFIRVYYGYDTSEDTEPERCDQVGTLRLMGRIRPLCRRADDGRIEASAKFGTDVATEVFISLYTDKSRYRSDLAKLRAVAASLMPCRTTWTVRGMTKTSGNGRPCPKGDWF